MPIETIQHKILLCVRVFMQTILFKQINVNMKKFGIVVMLLLTALSAVAQGSDLNLPKKSVKKILLLEKKSARYADDLKEIPTDVKEKEVVDLRMNMGGRLMLNSVIVPISEVSTCLNETRPTYLLLSHDVDAPVDSLGLLVDNVYKYYTKQERPVYFFRETLSIKKFMAEHPEEVRNEMGNGVSERVVVPSNRPHIVRTRVKLLTTTHPNYDRLYELQNRECVIPLPPLAKPKIVEIVPPEGYSPIQSTKDK